MEKIDSHHKPKKQKRKVRNEALSKEDGFSDQSDNILQEIRIMLHIHKLKRFVIAHWVEIFVITVCLTSVIISFVLLLFINREMSHEVLRVKERNGEISENATSASNSNKERQYIKPQIIVELSGSVQNPSVITVKKGMRLYEALKLAGGLSTDADKVYIAQNINLSQAVEDQKKYYFPSKTDVKNIEPTIRLETDQSETVQIAVNTASQKELESLVGIGETTAKKIIQNRPYANLEDLVSLKILSQNAFAKIEADLTL